MEHLETYERHFTVIVKNSARCRVCGDVITSRHRHDFVNCQCGEISLDGGVAYIRRLANDLTNIIDLSETRNYSIDELRAAKANAKKTMRDSIYSQGYYKTLIEAAEYYANLWYSCKI